MAPRRLAFALIGFAVAVAACSSATVLPSPPERSALALLTITTRGGMCPAGPCGSVVVIERDGRVHQTVPTAVELGTIPLPELTAMNVAIAATDFDAMRLRRFTGECPVAFDGQEVIYAFGAPTRVERIASCETEIDPGRPVFATLRAGLRAGGIAGVGP